jgi:hypothetical protein
VNKRLLPTIIAIAALVSAAYTLTLVDEFINSTLYSYGLVFSYEWANPYWTLLRVTWILLATCAVAITINTVLIVRSGSKHKTQSMETTPIRRAVGDTRPMLQTKEKPRPTSIAPGLPPSPKPAPKQAPTTAPAPSYTSSDVPAMFRCAHCGKAFTQPLRMLNFQVDPPRIVNVCPFCNETMPSGSTGKESEQNENRSFLGKDNGHVQKPLTQ